MPLSLRSRPAVTSSGRGSAIGPASPGYRSQSWWPRPPGRWPVRRSRSWHRWTAQRCSWTPMSTHGSRLQRGGAPGRLGKQPAARGAQRPDRDALTPSSSLGGTVPVRCGPSPACVSCRDEPQSIGTRRFGPDRRRGDDRVVGGRLAGACWCPHAPSRTGRADEAAAAYDAAIARTANQSEQTFLRRRLDALLAR